MNKTFFESGLHLPTLTTADDPRLKVIERDNGIVWQLRFEVNEELIDAISLEFLPRTQIHHSLLSLQVTDCDGNHVGTVKRVLQNALDLTL